jgi:hypothetical protein
MVTHDTTKLSLAFAIAAFRMSTRATSLAGVGRINQLDPHACQLRLVDDERPQLREAPIAVPRSLLPSNPCPRSDALEILKDDRPLRAFGFGNQPLANVVVGIFLKAPLAAGESLQLAFGRSGSDLLERLTTTRIPLTAALDMFTAKGFAIAVGCQPDHAQIDTQDTFDSTRFRRGNLATHQQIPLATNERKKSVPHSNGCVNRSWRPGASSTA